MLLRNPVIPVRMSTVQTASAPTSTRNRSAISNGSWLLEGVDNRSTLGRRYRDLCISYADDLGGASGLAEHQQSLIRQAAAVTVQCEKLQSKVIRGEAVDQDELVRLSNLLARLLKQLGVKEKGKPKRTLQDKLKGAGA